MVSMRGCPQSSHRPRSSLAHFAKRPLSGFPNREPRPWAKPGGNSLGLLKVACSPLITTFFARTKVTSVYGLPMNCWQYRQWQ